MGAVQRGGVVINMVVNVLAVCVGGNKKGVFAFRPAHGRLIADAVCLLGGNLSGLERLADLIAEHIRIPPLLPARDRLILCLGEQELRIGGLLVALIAGDQLPALGLVRVLPIFKAVFQRLGDGFPLADVVGNQARCGRVYSSFPREKRRLCSAAAPLLWDTLSRSRQSVIKHFKE